MVNICVICIKTDTLNQNQNIVYTIETCWCVLVFVGVRWGLFLATKQLQFFMRYVYCIQKHLLFFDILYQKCLKVPKVMGEEAGGVLLLAWLCGCVCDVCLASFQGWEEDGGAVWPGAVWPLSVMFWSVITF